MSGAMPETRDRQLPGHNINNEMALKSLWGHALHVKRLQSNCTQWRQFKPRQGGGMKNCWTAINIMNTKSGQKVSGNQRSIIELLYCRGKTSQHGDDNGKRTVRNVQHVDFTDVHCAEFEGLSEDCSLVISMGCQDGLPAKKNLTHTRILTCTLR